MIGYSLNMFACLRVYLYDRVVRWFAFNNKKKISFNFFFYLMCSGCVYLRDVVMSAVCFSKRKNS